MSGCILKAFITEQRDSNIWFLLTSLSTTMEQPANQSDRFWFKYTLFCIFKPKLGTFHAKISAFPR